MNWVTCFQRNAETCVNFTSTGVENPSRNALKRPCALDVFSLLIVLNSPPY